MTQIGITYDDDDDWKTALGTNTIKCPFSNIGKNAIKSNNYNIAHSFQCDANR